MEISKIEVNTYKIPLPEPVEAFAAGVMKVFDLVTCKIVNDDGEYGCLLYTSPSPRDT